MSGHAFRIDMGNLISVPAQSAPPSYTSTHIQLHVVYHVIVITTFLDDSELTASTAS